MMQIIISGISLQANGIDSLCQKRSCNRVQESLNVMIQIIFAVRVGVVQVKCRHGMGIF